jgi:alkanesulfonate monooxygenase SsuD/methylene tetrahydromethanopterin reductase-like flavin-dependent oxidoreductase (luciferase family)
MLPKPVRKPRPPVLIGGYVDRVLKRVATRSDGWLTYFYTPESFSSAWDKIISFAEEAGRDPSELTNVAQLPICIDASFEAADRKIKDFIARYFDVAPWSQSTPDSAIRGTVEQCAEQVQAQLDAGVRHICFVPNDYDEDQVERIAAELLPAVRGGAKTAGAAAT